MDLYIGYCNRTHVQKSALKKFLTDKGSTFVSPDTCDSHRESSRRESETVEKRQCIKR